MSNVMTYLTLDEKYQLLLNRIHSLVTWRNAFANYNSYKQQFSDGVDPAINPSHYGITDTRPYKEILSDIDGIWGDMKEHIMKELENVDQD
jgi:hypothetical protein